MKRAKVLRSIYLAAGISAIVFAILGLFGTVAFGLDKSYVLMGICAALSFYGFYGIPFYFYYFARFGIYMKICAAVADGAISYSEISARISVKPDIIKVFTEKCIRKKLLIGYEAEDNGIIINAENNYI